MAWQVFYSYSHKDATFRKTLSTYLAPLVQQKKIIEWHDRMIQPGGKWEVEISSQLESAHLILLLVSADFLASEYCFGVEVERALVRLKRNEVKVVPILLKPCLWEESRFSELQIIPRDAMAISSWASPEDALNEVAKEIRGIVSGPPPLAPAAPAGGSNVQRYDSSFDLVCGQVRSYAHLYERTRQRMPSSDQRTRHMQRIFEKMYALAPASYPLLPELVSSLSPGERLGAVAILQVFATEQHLKFLVKLVGTEKPFVGYQAAKALQFAVGSLPPSVYPQLLKAIHEAQSLLDSTDTPADADRRKVLRAAKQELEATITLLSVESA